MKVAHINAGNEYGGGLVHIVSLLKTLKDETVDLLVLEEGPVARAARQAGIKVFVFQQTSRYDLSVLKKLKTFIESKDYDLIHSHGPRANAVMAVLHTRLKAKWVTTVHSNPLLDFEANGLKGKVFEKVNKHALFKADGIIAVSNEIKTVLEHMGIESTKIEVIFNGIAFPKEELVKRPPSVFTILTIGRLHPIKGYNLMMKTLGEWKQANWQWIVLGDGEEEETLKLLSRQLSLDHKVEFKGWTSEKEVRQWLSLTTILVHPSLSESFPIVLLEAAEQQVPVIATRVGDVDKIVTDDSKGWLISPNSSKELVQALDEAYLLWQQCQLNQKGQELNKWAKQFTLDKQATHVLSFYSKLIN
ncbi:glycosyltransferase family 4 protein [Alkalibacterium sp. MB6]|uniref:glycosyltransferase family 4 protein n=1 Tax=Alkalibacterium sp. MB6 TaxID=2081965 RepID=UPI00137AF1E5|nr:glycosyltransferase family 4 protein [Alkalibacterium sp. MB6]